MRAVIGRKHLHELFENHILPRIRVSRFNGADIPVQNHAELIDHTLEDGVEDFVVVVAFAGAQFPFYDLIITGGQVAVVLVQVKNGMVEAGKMASRSVALHHEIYRRNPKINSIILTQSPALMGYCTTGVEFNVRTIPESWIFLQDVPRFPFGSQYYNLEGVAEEFKTRPCVLLENDSVIVTGDKLINTFDRLEVADFSARSLIMAAPVGKLHPINDEQVEELRKAFHVGE